jgi:hypothetical protein
MSHCCHLKRVKPNRASSGHALTKVPLVWARFARILRFCTSTRSHKDSCPMRDSTMALIFPSSILVGRPYVSMGRVCPPGTSLIKWRTLFPQEPGSWSWECKDWAKEMFPPRLRISFQKLSMRGIYTANTGVRLRAWRMAGMIVDLPTHKVRPLKRLCAAPN